MSNRSNTLFGIFKSKARNFLLLNFFLNPNKEFYTRELSRKLGSSVGNIANELKRIELTGLITSRNVGHILLYQANKQSPIFKEMKEIIIKTIGVEELLRPFFAKIPEIKSALIYGSYARGDFDATSDIDVMIVTSSSDDDFGIIYEKIFDLQEKLSREINPHFISKKELEKRIRDKSSYIQDVFENKKIFIKGGENELQIFSGKKGTN